MIKNSRAGKKVSKSLSFFKFIPLTPNQLTLLAIIFAFISFISFRDYPAVSFSIMIFAFLLDAIDGPVARAKGMVSDKGAFIDGVSDRIVEFLLILLLLIHFSTSVNLLISFILILFFGTCMTSFVKAYADHQDIITRKKALQMPGILERTERSVLLLIIFGLFLFGFPEYGLLFVYAGVLLSLITFIQRVYWTLSQKSFK
ncbi:CDP-alcohol phosphatidyltransferase family protein [Candidatus Micrarchaeota archaeon]|nr:CDP-alcohol phosphatidyltransferase family protein [Candidatus Micrarchaeota archaeon]